MDSERPHNSGLDETVHSNSNHGTQLVIQRTFSRKNRQDKWATVRIVHLFYSVCLISLYKVVCTSIGLPQKRPPR